MSNVKPLSFVQMEGLPKMRWIGFISLSFDLIVVINRNQRETKKNDRPSTRLKSESVFRPAWWVGANAVSLLSCPFRSSAAAGGARKVGS